jgi:pyrimidine deaminase RibD-like protein
VKVEGARESDEFYMARALALAERGRGSASPNPLVGAVIVDADGVIVGRGAHLRAGEAHAEIHAIADAGDRARGATLYCTLEPCSHTGRTGPCAPRVIEAGILRAVVATADPNPQVAGRGLQLLAAAGLDVRVGVMAAEAEALNRAFFTVMRRRRPFVTMKVALSADGRVAAPRAPHPDDGALVREARAPRAGRGRCGGGRVRNHPGRRSPPDGPGGVSTEASRAGGLRYPAADAAWSADVLDAGRRAGHNCDHAFRPRGPA